MTTNLRHLRLGRDLTQDELARRAQVERTRLSRVERGYGHLHQDELRRVARVLRVRVRDLSVEVKL